MSNSPYNCLTSSFVLFLQYPATHIGTNIYLSTFLSQIRKFSHSMLLSHTAPLVFNPSSHLRIMWRNIWSVLLSWFTHGVKINLFIYFFLHSMELTPIVGLTPINICSSWFLNLCTLHDDRGGTRCHSWFMNCTTSRKVVGSIPHGVIGIFRWHNPSDSTMILGLTQSLTEMNTRNISWG